MREVDYQVLQGKQTETNTDVCFVCSAAAFINSNNDALETISDVSAAETQIFLSELLPCCQLLLLALQLQHQTDKNWSLE